MAAHDTDCYCELPLAVADEELESACRNPGSLLRRPVSTLPLTGFVAFCRLCHISGKIQGLHSPSRFSDLSSEEGGKRLVKLVGKLDQSLNEWLTSLPDDIRFSAK